MLGFPLMLWVKLPVVERIQPQSNKFATGVENQGTGDSKRNDSPTCILFYRVLSIMPKILEILVRIGMERSISVSSGLNIRDHLWRWFGFINWVDNVNWPLVRDSKANVLSVSPSSKQMDLWRWSTYFGWKISTKIRRSIFDKPVLCPNLGILKRNKKWQEQFLLVGPV